MYLLMLGISEPLTEMAFRLVTFVLALGATFLIPYIILVTLLGDRDIARYISAGICLLLFFISTQNGIFFDHFDLSR